MKAQVVKDFSDRSSKLLAFNLFRKKGMNAVKSSYPEHVEFVQQRKEKSLREVKNELNGQQVHA